MVILSLVRNNAEKRTHFGIGFLANRSRANVMFSRAERLLVVVGCADRFRQVPRRRSWIPQVFDFIAASEDVL